MNVALTSQVFAPAPADTGNTSTSTYKSQAPAKSAWGGEYRQDIAGKVMDNEAYGHGLTAEDIMQKAANTDVSVQKDFMVVMSHCVSGEDYKKLQEEGFNPASADVETYVTVVDKIKVALAEAGVEITGYNDDLDIEKIEEITGSRMSAERIVETVAQGAKITEISDEAIKYMVQNRKEPTIENLYKAQFLGSGNMKQPQGYYSENIAGGSYYAKKADSINWDNLESQIEAVVEKADLGESAVDDAKWLVEAGIELNVENLSLVSNLRSLSSKLPLEQQELERLCTAAVENGKKPSDALLSGEELITDKAAEILEAVENISDEAVQKTVESGDIINIKNLANAQQAIENALSLKETEGSLKESETSLKEIEPSLKETEGSLKAIEAKAKLEEIRLMMSEEANRHLLRKGMQIDTAELSKVVEALKQAQEEIRASLFKGENPEENGARALIFEETLTKTKEIREMPAAVIGKLVMSRDSYTLNRLYNEGVELKKTDNVANENKNQQQALQSYETLMTAPRKDLGDRIGKAFRNVDDILVDMGLETSDANRRAVRILGYNSMEITEENIEKVKIEDSKVNSVISKITPAAALQMIREKKNPLEMTMEELENYLNKKDRAFDGSAEKYSVFLQKLDRAGQISEAEREAYIGIYRLFNQIEKSDGAVIGSIVAAGAQMNFKNMLSAVRTSNGKNMDVKVDDEFGALEQFIKKGKAIDEQIMSGFDSENFRDPQQQRNNEQYYARLSGEINTTLSKTVDVEKLKDVDISEGTTIEKFADSIKMTQVSESFEKQEQWQRESLRNFRESLKEAHKTEERVIEALIDYGQTISVDNINAAQTLMMDRGSLFRQIIKLSDDDDVDNESEDEAAAAVAEGEMSSAEQGILAKAEQFGRSLTDRESAAAAYEGIIDRAKAAVEKVSFANGASFVDVKAAQSLYKGLLLAGNLAREENYEVPMSINGEITSVNLKIYHNAIKQGKVSVTFETKALGKVAADFDVTDRSISGMAVYENKASKAELEQLKAAVENELSKEGEGSVNVSVVQSKPLDLGRFGQDRASGGAVSTSALYKVAKAFLTALTDLNI